MEGEGEATAGRGDGGSCRLLPVSQRQDLSGGAAQAMGGTSAPSRSFAS